MSEAPLRLGHIALGGGAVTGAAQAVRIAVQLASVVVLARLLVPEDFGLVASVGPVIAFVGLFQNLGLQQAVIQKRRIGRRQLNQVFWVTGAVGVASVALVTALAPAIAAFYGDRRIAAITMVAAIPLLLGSLASLPLSLLNRELRFGRLAFNDVLVAALGLVAAVAAALLGFGYWSLVLGTTVSAATALLAAWLATRWVPGRPDLRLDPQILSFGANLTGFNFANFFARNLDNVLIARYAGAVELGYYDRAYKLVLFPLQNVNQPLSRVMIPLLSRIHEDKARFRDVFMRTNWLLAAVTMPGVAALTLTSEQVVGLLFGEKWLPSAPIFAWLGIAGLIQPVSSTTGWIFICQGRTRTMFRWGIYASLTTIASFVVGLQWGAVGVAAAYAVGGYVLRLPVLAVLVHRTGPVTGMDFLLVQGVFIASSALAWLGYAVLDAAWPWRSDLLAVLAALALSYGSALVVAMLVGPSRRAMLSSLATVRNLRRGPAVRQI